MSAELATNAFCWRIEREDGFGLALTSHDAALMVDGIRHEPAPGMTPAAIRRELGLDPASSEVAGALSAVSITEADLVAGRWDNAALRLTSVQWDDPEGGAVALLSGRLGMVQEKGAEFSADLLGAAAELDRPVCPQTSPECRAELGDRRCRVDMAGRSQRCAVASCAGNVLVVDRPIGDDYRFGSVRILGGAMNGRRFTILAVDGAQLTLRNSPVEPVPAGTAVMLAQGCDKSLATCSARFGNAANFRGEPHLPGNDLLTRYPGS